MADAGHVATDKILEKLEKDIAAEYKTATEEMQAKLTAYLEKTEAQRQVQESLLKAGKITKQEYSDWCFRHNMMGKRWEEMRDVLASDMHHTNEIAKGIMEKRMPDVYALNGNYATYQIEHDGQIDTGFTLYNHDTAEYLLGDQRQLMPAPSTKKAAQIAANKDMQWNKQKIQSAVLQGVLQGESPYAVAERLRSVGQMNYNSSIRYARTMTTSAQNAGRYEAYRRARDLGVDLTIEWQATIDHRTRHAHRMMHGQRTEVDKPFHTPDGYTIYYPADCTGESTAPQKEIWNCRCTLLSWVKGFEGDTVKSSPKMGEMSFDEWQETKPDYEQRKTREGSRQKREKRESVASMPTATAKPSESPDVVQGLKPIVGKHSRAQDLKAVNPNYETGLQEWQNNCQRCVATYEARRRGYDVTALPCMDYRSDEFALGRGYTKIFESNGRKASAIWYEAGFNIMEATNLTNAQCRETIENLMRGYGNGARAIVDGFFEYSGVGHVFIAENVGGKIHYYDPQTNNLNCSGNLDIMRPYSMALFRIDDLPFTNRIKDVFRNDIV